MIRLANMPMPHVTTIAHSVLDLFRVNSTPENIQCATPVAKVIHLQSTALKTQILFISPADWDDLFVAVQTRLENCVNGTSNSASTPPLQDQKSKVKKAVAECVDDLRHLHRSLTLERQSHQKR